MHWNWNREQQHAFKVVFGRMLWSKSNKKRVWMRVVAHCQMKSIMHYLRNYWFLRFKIARRVATSHEISSPIDELNEIGLNFRTLEFYHMNNAEICILNACQLAVQWLWHRSMTVNDNLKSTKYNINWTKHSISISIWILIDFSFESLDHSIKSGFVHRADQNAWPNKK